MLLGTVVGRVWVDRQIDDLHGQRLVLVAHGDNHQLVAVDMLDAGMGHQVLISTDDAARAVSGLDGVDAVIVALVTGTDEIAS